MGTPWEILGLEAPTNDLKQIEQAYDSRLKHAQLSLDEHRVIALREALEHATEYAAWPTERGPARDFGDLLNQDDMCAPKPLIKVSV